VPQTATLDATGDLNQAKNRQTIGEFFNEIDPGAARRAPMASTVGRWPLLTYSVEKLPEWFR
jgi:hypothetical protein